MPNGHSVLAFIGRNTCHHEVRIEIPFTLFDRVLGLDFVKVLWDVAAPIEIHLFFLFDVVDEVPDLDCVVLAAGKQDVTLIGMPIETHGRSQVYVEIEHRHDLLPLVPNADTAVLLTARQVIGVVWIVFDLFNAEGIVEFCSHPVASVLDPAELLGRHIDVKYVDFAIVAS